MPNYKRAFYSRRNMVFHRYVESGNYPINWCVDLGDVVSGED